MSEETREKVSSNSSCANLYLVSRVDDATISNGITNITAPAGELFLRLQNSVSVAKKQFNEHYEVLVLLRRHGKLL
jgi:hypothetical protein